MKYKYHDEEDFQFNSNVIIDPFLSWDGGFFFYPSESSCSIDFQKKL
jgi:hypothetical protein